MSTTGSSINVLNIDMIMEFAGQLLQTGEMRKIFGSKRLKLIRRVHAV